MADKETKGLVKGLIWNDAKVLIKSATAADSTENWTWIKGVAEFAPPSQADNTVELPYINQDDRITAKVKGTRAGGDISGTINARFDGGAAESDASLKGLQAAIGAYNDPTGEYSIKWLWEDLGVYALVERAIITDCSVQGGSLDTVVSYSLAATCNSKVKYFEVGA